jgi:acyl-coenzyme A synthetase/AMP-(fatty) acid ligase
MFSSLRVCVSGLRVCVSGGGLGKVDEDGYFCIVDRKQGVTATPAELRAFVREQMAPYKYPRRVWLVPGLPGGPTGKFLRREGQPPEDLR